MKLINAVSLYLFLNIVSVVAIEANEKTQDVAQNSTKIENDKTELTHEERTFSGLRDLLFAGINAYLAYDSYKLMEFAKYNWEINPTPFKLFFIPIVQMRGEKQIYIHGFWCALSVLGAVIYAKKAYKKLICSEKMYKEKQSFWSL